MMHSISAILIKPFTKPFIKAGAKLICISLLFITQTAHADFRKALDAYMARDGATMLKEVKDAVGKKNDDGLMLLLMATNMDAVTSDYDETTKQSKSTLRAILSHPKWDEMRELLVQATNNSTVDAQYYLLTKSVFKSDLYKKQLGLKVTDVSALTNQQYIKAKQNVTDVYTKRGSKLAMLNDTIENKAAAGEPLSQLSLGLKYLNYGKDVDYGAHYGCGYLSKLPICQTKDEVKGNDWLKRAAKSYDLNGFGDFDLLPSQMCEFLRNTANGDQAKLKQAYLWALFGMNERAGTSKSKSCLVDMHDTGVLKLVAPQIDAAWGGDWKAFNALVYKEKLNELPDLIVQNKSEMANETLPVLTYHFEQVMLDVFKNGSVFIGLTDSYPNELFKNVSPSTVKAFLSELEKTGFYQWTTAESFSGVCPDFDSCSTIDMHITARDGTKTQRLFFSVQDKKSVILSGKFFNTKRMAILKTLVDKYFPTQHLRCELGNSKKYKQSCLEFDNQWAAISIEGK